MGRRHRGKYPDNWKATAMRVKHQAGWRCVRCGHPHEKPGQRIACTTDCDLNYHPEWHKTPPGRATVEDYTRGKVTAMNWRGDTWVRTRQRQRVLTVAHLDDDKSNCAWWNLAALCQVCHLVTQAKIEMDRPWLLPHSEWFEPYVAGFYAHKYLGLQLTQGEVNEGLEALLILERMAADAESREETRQHFLDMRAQAAVL